MGRYGEIRGDTGRAARSAGLAWPRGAPAPAGDTGRYVEICGDTRSSGALSRERVRESDHEALHGGAALATESQSIRVVSTATQAPAPCAAAPPAPPSARRRRLRRCGRRTERRSGRPEGRQRAEADQIWGDIGRYGEIWGNTGRGGSEQRRFHFAWASLGAVAARLSTSAVSLSAVPLFSRLLSAGSRLSLR